MTEKRGEEPTGVFEVAQPGLSSLELADEDSLTTAMLQSIYEDLVETGAIDDSGVHDAPAAAEMDTVASERRTSTRFSPDLPLTLYDVKRPEIQGTVDNISERGIGITRIASRLDEINTFVIPGNQIEGIDSIALTTVCRWTTILGGNQSRISGHEIVHISEYDLLELRKMVKHVSFGY